MNIVAVGNGNNKEALLTMFLLFYMKENILKISRIEIPFRCIPCSHQLNKYFSALTIPQFVLNYTHTDDASHLFYPRINVYLVYLSTCT